jgi:hypothetical protein
VAINEPRAPNGGMDPPGAQERIREKASGDQVRFERGRRRRNVGGRGKASAVMGIKLRTEIASN